MLARSHLHALDLILMRFARACMNASRKVGRKRHSDPLRPSLAEPLSARDSTRQEQLLEAANARIRALAFHITQLQVVFEPSICISIHLSHTHTHTHTIYIYIYIERECVCV